jgi:outer membrane protein assembly factor BamB
MKRVTVLAFLALLIGTRTAMTEDWPQFRGPGVNGVSQEHGINKDWAAHPPKVLWKLDLKDNGNAAPAVAGERVYIVDHQGAQDIVRALDLSTGTQAWQFEYDDAKQNKYGFTVSTPLIDHGKLYVLSRLGKVTCLDAAKGEQLWQRNLMAEIKARRPGWDYCMSPVLDGDKLIFAPGGEGTGVVALDKATGQTLWKGGGGGLTSYGTPLVAQIDGKKQYIALTAMAVKGVAAEDGKLLWEVAWPNKYDKKGPSPVLVGERVLIATTEGGDTGLIEVKDNTPTLVWKTKTIQCHFTTPVLYHDRVWACSDANMMAFEPLTGKILWKKKGFEHASLIAVDDTVIGLNGADGKLFMLDATAEEYKELGSFSPLGGVSWTPPVIAGGKLLVRNLKTLVCLDLK